MRMALIATKLKDPGWIQLHKMLTRKSNPWQETVPLRPFPRTDPDPEPSKPVRYPTVIIQKDPHVTV
jgi:hypothetical protein